MIHVWNLVTACSFWNIKYDTCHCINISQPVASISGIWIIIHILNFVTACSIWNTNHNVKFKVHFFLKKTSGLYIPQATLPHDSHMKSNTYKVHMKGNCQCSKHGNMEKSFVLLCIYWKPKFMLFHKIVSYPPSYLPMLLFFATWSS